MAKKSATKKNTKKKVAKKPKKTAKKGQPADWTLRWLVILLVVAIVAVFLYYTCRPQVKRTIDKVVTKTEKVIKKQIQPKDTTQKDNRSKEAPHNKKAVKKADNITYTKLEIPKWDTSTTRQQIENTGYTSSFNSTTGMPNWVAYELTRTEVSGEAVRKNRFRIDPETKGFSADNNHYKGSGYDKGHMAPAADMKWSQTAMDESFYFSNICPQAPGLNRNSWKELEEEIRLWAIRDSALTIICGPLFTNEEKKYIPDTKVAIPDAFFKVVCAPYTQPAKAIAFVFPNVSTSKHPREYVVTTDNVEKLTGMDFLWQLPDEIENEIEQTSNYINWE